MSLDDSEDCGCTGDPERAVDDPQYRRALWIVIILNVGFGMIELAAGFLAASQALKADALDFLGDGSITFIGLLALGWTASTRARVALAQGLFLAALGVSVIGAAIWHATMPWPMSRSSSQPVWFIGWEAHGLISSWPLRLRFCSSIRLSKLSAMRAAI